MLELKTYRTQVHNDWCPGCVLPNTLVHSNPSVKEIQQVAEGDRVLGRDGKFHKVREVLRHIHRGKIFRLGTKCFGETYLTPEHPVLIVRRTDRNRKLHNREFDAVWVRADQVRVHDCVVYPVLKEESSRKSVDVDYHLREKDTVSKELPPEIPLNSGMLRLMGYYVSEGHVHKREIGFTFNATEVSFIEDVKRLGKEIFGLEATVTTKRNASTVIFYSAPLARLFSEWFGRRSFDKRLPHFAMLVSAQNQVELIKGLWRGDGWINPRQARANFKTTSKTLCEQMKILLLRQGVVPVITVSKANGFHKESYSIQVVNDREFATLARVLDQNLKVESPIGKPPSSIVQPDYALMPVKVIESFDYVGPVYNLEVDDVNSYVTENAVLHNCGDFGIVNAIQMTLLEMQLEPHRVTVVSGIGCSGKTPHYINAYGFHTLHGRSLPIATGIKLANPELTVVAVGGDGDGLGIGAGHFVNTGRRNLDFTYVLFNNQVYGLTKGQASPTLPKGLKTKSMPAPAIVEGVNPIAMALASGYTFVARSYALDVRHLKQTLRQAIEHRGSAFVDVLQTCPTYNDINTKEWYAGDDLPVKQPRLYKMEEAGYNGLVNDATNHEEATQRKIDAFIKSFEWGDKIPIGVFYKLNTLTYEDQLSARMPALKEKPFVKQDVYNRDITPLFEELS